MATTVKLMYFKQSGKYYSNGEYETEKTMWHEMIDEIKQLKVDGKLPDLVDGAREFIIFVEGVEPWGVPHIIR